MKTNPRREEHTVWTYSVLTNQTAGHLRGNTCVARLIGCGLRAEIAGQLPALLAKLDLAGALAAGQVRVLIQTKGIWTPYRLRETQNGVTEITRRNRARFLAARPARALATC